MATAITSRRFFMRSFFASALAVANTTRLNHLELFERPSNAGPIRSRFCSSHLFQRPFRNSISAPLKRVAPELAFDARQCLCLRIVDEFENSSRFAALSCREGDNAL